MTHDQRWIPALSLPAALLGVVAFFLPWMEVSCRMFPVAMSVSGYEIATGEADRKFSAESRKEFEAKLDESFDPALGKQPRTTRRRPQQRATSVPAQGSRLQVATGVRLLWLLPGCCAFLALLTLFGLPRIPTLLTSALGAAYLAYQTIDAERVFSDPAVTGGMFQARWLFGYWATWVGLLLPAVLAQIRQREVPEPAAIESADSMPWNRFR